VSHLHHRSLRLPGYDYSQAGAYFVTVCTNHRICLFGSVDGGTFTPNEAGIEMEQGWNTLPARFPHVTLDAFVVMPNHVHDILLFDGSESGNVSLSSVVGAFKSLSTVSYGRGVRRQGWLPFDGRLWQASFYEHVIRSEEAMNRIRSYIQENPARWEHDLENLSGQS
jgi:putative transposase